MNDISNIVNGIDVKDDFSFVDTLGKLICNRDFSLSYDKFKGGQKSAETFIWESLQNIGNEFGKKIHQNIRDYIDLVSNVDRCKIKSLQSMFKMYGQQYKIIDNILKYPLEIQNLIDLFSISRKYLLKNDFLNEDFKQQLIDNYIITKNPLSGEYNYYDIQLDSNKFNIYVKNIFKQLIIDFLELRYNDSNHTKIIDTLNPLDDYSSLDNTEEEIEKYKRENNVPVSFNQVKIVNDIDNGVDFLENYFGIELKILNMEIDRRAKTLSIIDINNDNTLINTDNYSVEQKTRYSYYRKAKFLEYRDFVDNMFTKGNNLSSINRYSFNNSFIEFDKIDSDSVLVWNSVNSKYEINESIVENVSSQLMEMTEYLVSLRERLKIQTRKNYMRGTSNLLIYVINQYLVDYSKTHKIFFNSLSNYNQLSSLYEKLLNHSSENINVIEYTDQTEYFNTKTDSTKYALNENDANERYWEGQNAQTAGYISDSEIQNFYLDRLQLSSESGITNAFEFLDTIFNLGASDSYIDRETGIFSTQLDEKNETWSLDYVKQLSSIDYNWGKISGYLNFGKDNAYEFPETAISNQISAAINDYIYQQISVQNLSSVSEVYDIFKPQLDDISSKIDNLRESYFSFVGGQYGNYFEEYISSIVQAGIDEKIEGLVSFSIHGLDNVENKILYKVNVLSGKINEISSQYLSGFSVSSPYLENEQTIQQDSNEQNVLFGSTSQTSATSYLLALKDTLDSINVQLEEFLKQVKVSDDKDKDIVKNQVNTILDQSTEIKNQLLEIESNIQNYIPGVMFSNGSIEEKLEFDLKLITNDKEDKLEQANINIQNQMEDVEITFENIENIISSFLSTDTNLCSIIQQQKDFLNLSDNDVYMTSLNMYNMYNGLCADSEVYFNYKNITHPSRQFHPYLRNMINSESLKDIFDNVLKQYQIDELDEESIQNSINKYIGTFGQMINIWKTPIIDYTGYSSRYEQSDKIVDRTGLKQEIVDYDGLFYPEAVRLLKENKNNCINSIQYGIDKKSYPELSSFYDRFYAPLGLTTSELQNEKIRLETYADDIIRIATEQNNELSVYDIYKYGIDGYGNSYSLLKLYPDLRYSTKKNQSGRLWMRLKSYPFSYPAFSNHGNLSVDPQYTAFENVIEDEISSNISSNYGKIYDFEFSNDKSILAIITENSSNDEHTFDTANVFVSRISLYDDNFVIEDADIFKHEKVENVLESKSASNFKKLSSLTLADCLGETLNNVISTEMSVLLNSDKISSVLSIDNIGNKTLYDIYNSELSNISSLISANLNSQYNEGPTDGLFYSLVGCTPYKSNNFRVSYILKHFKYDQTNDIVEKSIPEYTKFSIVDYNQQKSAVGDSIKLPRNAVGTDVVVADINDKNVSFGLLIESQLSNDETVLTAYTSQDGNLSANNANGPTIESDDTEMNSHDIFTSDILVRTFNLREQSIEMLYEQIFNINSDISYIPVYPGEGNVAKLNAKSISSDNYFTIELLGSSKNIDNDIQQVNPNPNPYVTMEDIQTKQQFGRVYEDYIPENDTSLQILNNPRIDTNPISGSNVYYNEEEQYFQWKIKLSEVFKPSDVKYDEDDYDKLKILIYNVDTYGKNPYIMDDLTALQSEKYVYYTSDISSYEEYVNQFVDIVGTYNNKGMNSLENNSLDSISAISLKFDDTSKYLTLNFYVNGSVYSVDSDYNINNVFVDANKIKVCLINDKNLKMFEYYHYMDAFGIKISADYFPSDKRFSNYYMNDRDEKIYLSSINFANYDGLSDIEILSGIDGAIFKYGEEIQFELSNNMVYMPTINTWYPKTAGQYMAEKSITMKPSNDQKLTTFFSDNQIYYIDIPDQKQIIDALEYVYVSSYIDNSNTLMMDEDVYISASNTIHAIEDPRIFEKGIVANISSDYISSDIITAEYEKISMEQFIDNLVEKGLSPMATEQGSQASIHSIQIDNKNNIDIERFLRLHVNYKKDIEQENGIVLYFNYLNYVNTPYIRLDEGKIYPSIIDGTFLKLNPGENGILNIVLQFRYYEHGKVMGVSNKTVLSYHIYNISDDKPKFLIREIFRIKSGYTGQKEELPFKMSGGDISCKNNSTFNYSIGWETISQIEKLSFDLVFDGYMMECLGGNGIVQNGPSTITVNVQNFTQNFIDIPFRIIKANVGDYATIYLDNINVVPTDNNFILLSENEHDGKVTIID